jgi:hypothetical protein
MSFTKLKEVIFSSTKFIDSCHPRNWIKLLSHPKSSYIHVIHEIEWSYFLIQKLHRFVSSTKLNEVTFSSTKIHSYILCFLDDETTLSSPPAWRATHAHKGRGVRRTDEETPLAFAFLKITVGRETSARVSSSGPFRLLLRDFQMRPSSFASAVGGNRVWEPVDAIFPWKRGELKLFCLRY